jgi:hypothetical protein
LRALRGGGKKFPFFYTLWICNMLLCYDLKNKI